MSRFYSKSAGTNMRRRLYLAVLTALSGSAYAVPEGGRVTAGAAEISGNGDVFTVEQQSQRAVLEFDSFDVAAHEIVNFVQPNGDSVALNRVLGSDLSQIHGSINANGHVYLINPNGVLFGAGAQINVGGLMATTLDMNDQEFLDRHEQLQGEAQGLVENRGQIRARDRVALVAPDIINSGDISVSGGEVMLRSSRNVLLHSSGSEIPILVDDPQLVGQIINEGSIAAGHVAMALDGRGQLDVYDNAINNSGIIRAVAASGEGGSVRLLAGAGDVVHSGEINTDAERDRAGEIIIRATRYGQTGVINSNGAGGGAGGEVTLRAEQTIAMTDTSRINANGGNNGDGGEVILYADRDTRFAQGSKISARGGDSSGDGGFVEVSGREFVAVDGEVNVGANNGNGGLWYIDPTDIEIREAASSGGGFVQDGAQYSWSFDDPAPTTASVSRTTIVNTLKNNGDVYISTESGADASGDLKVNAVIDFDGVPEGRTLTLRANNTLSFEGGSRIFDGNPGDEGLNLVLDAGSSIKFNGSSFVELGSGRFTATSGASLLDPSFWLAGDASITATGVEINAAVTPSEVNTGAHILMEPAAVIDAGTDTAAISAGTNVTVASILSTSAADDAISISALGGQIIDDGDATTSMTAVNGGVFLRAANGVGLANQIDANAARFGVQVTDSGDLNVHFVNDVTLTSLVLGSNMTFDIRSDGMITYTGTLGGDLDGAVNSTISLTAGTLLNIAGDLADMTGAVDNDVDLNFTAATGFTVGDGVNVNAGSGLININTLAGNAVVTGLSSLSVMDNAISVSAASGQILDGGDTRLDLHAPDGGMVLNAMGDVVGLETNVSVFDSVSSAGNVELHEEDSFSALRLEAADTATLTAGGDFTLGDPMNFSANHLSVTAGGAIKVPTSGFTMDGILSLDGADIVQEDGLRGVELGASTLNITTGLSGGDLSVNTTADHLSVVNSGTNALNVTDSDSVTLLNLSSQTGATTVITATGHDLILGGAIDLDGSSGALGLSSGKDLLIDVDIADMTGAVDNATNLVLSANNNITFAAGTQVNGGAADVAVATVDGSVALGHVLGRDIVITSGGDITDANDGALNVSGASATFTAAGNIGSSLNALDSNLADLILDAQDVYLSNDSAMTLSILAANNLSVSNSGSLTLSEIAPTISGTVDFDIAAGDLILSAAGLILSSDLTINAQNVINANEGAPLVAANADITLAAAGVDTTLAVDFDTLVLQVMGGQSVAITDSSALSVTSANTAGDLALSAADNLMITDASPVFGNNLSLMSGATLTVAPGVLSVADTLTLSALNLTDGDSQVDLSATNAVVSLQPGAALTLATTVSDLDLSVSGTQTVTVNEVDGLNLSSMTAASDVQITAAAGDITFSTDTIDVAGRTSLVTMGTGEVVINEGGLSTSGDLTISAASLRDSDTLVNVQANHADITLRGQSQGLTLASSIRELDFDHAASSALQIIQNGDLLVNQLTAGGDIRIDADANLTFAPVAPGVAGDLELLVADTLTIADGGLQVDGTLAVDATIVANATGMGTTAWQAGNADIRIRNSAQGNGISTQVDQLSLNYNGVNAFTASVQGGTVVSGLTATADLTVASAGNMLLTTATPAVTGALTLQANGTLALADAGLSVADSLQISAADLVNSNGGAVSLSGNRAEINLSGNQSLSLMTQLAQLGIHYGAAADLNAVNSGDLELTSWQVDNATNVGLSASGTLTIPETGLSAPGRLAIDASDMMDSDRELNLQAEQLLVQLSASESNNIWNIAAGQVDVLLRGQANLQLRAGSPIVLQDLNEDGQAVDIGDGNIGVLVRDGSLQVNGNVYAQDQNADGQRSGIIDMQVANGDIQIGTNSDAAVVSTNNVDHRASSAAGGENGIRLQLTDASSADRQIVLGSGGSLRAIGGDIELNAKPVGTAESAQRLISVRAGASVSAYTAIDDPLSGVISVNGKVTSPQPWQQIRQGRALALIADFNDGPDLGEVFEEIEDIEGGIDLKNETPTQSRHAAMQYDAVFGRCNELEQSGSQRCRIDAALKAFLSHWLVGGEMPPKSEI